MSNKRKFVRIKPHHCIDILRALGRDDQQVLKPHAYGHDLHAVAQAVFAREDLPLEMELGIDDICQPCMHHIDHGCDDVIDTSSRPDAPPSKQAWNLLIDRRWCQALKVEQGTRLNAQEFCRRVLSCIHESPSIYCEMPTDTVTQRNSELLRGIKIFLGIS